MNKIIYRNVFDYAGGIICIGYDVNIWFVYNLESVIGEHYK